MRTATYDAASRGFVDGNLEENLAAVDIVPPPEDIAAIEAAAPVEAIAGSCYDATSLKFVDG